MDILFIVTLVSVSVLLVTALFTYVGTGVYITNLSTRFDELAMKPGSNVSHSLKLYALPVSKDTLPPMLRFFAEVHLGETNLRDVARHYYVIKNYETLIAEFKANDYANRKFLRGNSRVTIVAP